MPANILDHAKWKKAKTKAREQYGTTLPEDRFYAATQKIYQSMGGGYTHTSKAIMRSDLQKGVGKEIFRMGSAAVKGKIKAPLSSIGRKSWPTIRGIGRKFKVGSFPRELAAKYGGLLQRDPSKAGLAVLGAGAVGAVGAYGAYRGAKALAQRRRRREDEEGGLRGARRFRGTIGRARLGMEHISRIGRGGTKIQLKRKGKKVFRTVSPGEHARKAGMHFREAGGGVGRGIKSVGRGVKKHPGYTAIGTIGAGTVYVKTRKNKEEPKPYYVEQGVRSGDMRKTARKPRPKPSRAYSAGRKVYRKGKRYFKKHPYMRRGVQTAAVATPLIMLAPRDKEVGKMEKKFQYKGRTITGVKRRPFTQRGRERVVAMEPSRIEAQKGAERYVKKPQKATRMERAKDAIWQARKKARKAEMVYQPAMIRAAQKVGPAVVRGARKAGRKVLIGGATVGGLVGAGVLAESLKRKKKTEKILGGPEEKLNLRKVKGLRDFVGLAQSQGVLFKRGRR